ncbi:MAG: EndoU domain-containing protein [Lachnospiraceae bacterium]|nr:EndoU domain-containing protein [Lachnospiraceae bacterium]MBO6089925.1 EndoU domain-containing protein [Lachnospiraceae bacterium]
MGTTKSGRVLNTRGSRGSASQFSVVHSNEGAYTKPIKGNRIKLKSGGHGQAGMNELDKYGIRYKVEKTYPNGVRVGYVIDHTNKAKRESMGQSWFPKNWTSKDIKHAGEHVANLKGNRHSKDGVAVYGMWKGVRVGVIRTHGQIGTIFPDSKQPYGKRGKN